MKSLYCFMVRMYYKVLKKTKVTGHIWAEENGKIYCSRCGKKR